MRKEEILFAATLVLFVGCFKVGGTRRTVNNVDSVMAPLFSRGTSVHIIPLAELKSPPGKGDVVAYQNEIGVVLINRIVGVSGEKVEFKAGILYVDGMDHLRNQLSHESCQGLIKASFGPDVVSANEVECVNELSGFRRYIIFKERERRPFDFGPVIVPEKSYFLLGDSRIIPRSSSGPVHPIEFKTVAARQIIGLVDTGSSP